MRDHATHSQDDPQEDAMLIESIARGDNDAFRILMDRYLPPLHAMARRMTGDPILAEDIAQETFARIWKDAGRFSRDKGAARSWISTIAVNLCRDANRRRRPESPDLLEGVIDSAPDAPALMELRERERAVRHALQRLPERQREAVLLFYDLEMKQSQIADALGISVDAVESLLARARRALARELQPLLLADDDAAPQDQKIQKGSQQ